MKYRIIADSGCDINQASGEKLDVTIVPLTICIGDKEFRDDHSLDVENMLNVMNASQIAPKTACPSLVILWRLTKEKRKACLLLPCPRK